MWPFAGRKQKIPTGDFSNKISHVAFIMDGNGRWATRRGMPREMGHARGAICLAASLSGIPVVPYAATAVKKALTGNGRAPKDQMQRAIQHELGLKTYPKPPDVADALAIALCHLYTFL